MPPLPSYQELSRRRVQSILERHKDKNFVQRILNRNNYPRLDLGNGQYVTHKMSWATIDDRPIVYPTVIYDYEADTLRDLGPQEGLQHALRTSEYIPFEKEAEADWFSKSYKSVWGEE